MAAARLMRRWAAGLVGAAVWMAAPCGTLAATFGTLDTTLYLGGVVRMRVDGSDLTILRIDVDLQEYLELVAVEDEFQQPIFSSADLYDPALCTADSNGVFMCSSERVLGTLRIRPELGADGHQHVVIRDDFLGSGWPAFHLLVRLAREATGASLAPEAVFSDPTALPPFLQSLQDNVLLAGATSPARVASVRLALDPGATAAPRGGSAAAFGIIVDLSDGTNGVAVREAVSVASVVEDLFECRRSGEASFGACSGPPFDAFASLRGVADQPAGLELAAVVPAGRPPDPGDAEIQITYGGQQGVLVVPVEQPVVQGQFAIGTAEPMPIRETEKPVQLVVTQALNQYGGPEPPTATYSLAAATLPEGTYSLDPSGIVTVHALPQQAGTLTVVGTHVNPTGAPVTASLVLQVAEAPPGCSLVVTPTAVPVSGSAELRIERSDGAVPDATLVVERWEVEQGGGEVAADANGPGRAVFSAPPAPSTVRIRADVSGTFCPEGSVAADVEIIQDIAVQLRLERKRLEPGGTTRAEAIVTNLAGTPLGGVGLRLRLDDRLRLVGEARGAIGTAVSRGAATARTRTYALELDAAAEHVVSLVLFARPAATCNAGRLTVELYRGEADAPALSAASTEVKIACEPELTEATLVGRVFLDTNANGQQDDGESGLPGALVATAAGVYAVTDATGSYHIARLPPGRHAIKIDRSTLPPGARAPEPRREVTLTPGTFTRVSFAIELPNLTLPAALGLDVEASGVALADGTPVYRARFRLPLDGTFAAYRGDSRRAANAEGQVDLPLDGGGDHWTLVLSAEDGRTFLWSFAVHVYTRPDGGRLVVPWGPRFLAALALPAAGDATPARLPLRAALQETSPLVVRAPGQAGECGLGNGPGAAQCELALGDATAIEVVLDPEADAAGDDPPAANVALSLPPVGHEQLFVGLAGVELQGIGERARDWDGGGSFFYRGRFADRWLVTAGADMRKDLFFDEAGERRSLSSALGRLFGHDPRRVFRDLDPEAYYPTYGDGSLVVDEREAGGRLFLRLQSGQSYLKWGGVNTAIADAEYGQYVRSLYGLGGQLVLDGPARPVEVQAVVFGARPDAVAARDELLVTGGSLYFLSHREIVEGSLRVVLEVLDEISHLPMRVVPLAEGVDFEADYAGGRLSLDPTLPGRTFGGSLTGAEAGGDTARLLVDYEYYPGADLSRDVTAGGRAVVRKGPVSLGVSAVGELAGRLDLAAASRPRYRLLGATARLDLQRALQVRAELAHSLGQSHVASRSWDGGLSFEEVHDKEAERAGCAALVELSTELGPVRATAYGRYLEPGFTDSRTAPGAALEQAGGRVLVEPAHRARAWAQADWRRYHPLGMPIREREVALVGGAQGFGRLQLAAEGRFERQSAREDLWVIGAEASVRAATDLELRARRRQPIGGEEGQGAVGATAVGATYLAGALVAGAEAGITDERRGFGRLQTSFPLVDGAELYAAYVVGGRIGGTTLDEAAANRDDSLVLGGKRRLADGTALYAEQRLGVGDAGRRLTRSVGAENVVAHRIGLLLSYERGTIERDDPTSVVVRDAGSVGASYTSDRWLLHLAVDGRHDDGPASRLLQVGGRGRLEVRLWRGLTLAAGARGASTYDIDDGDAGLLPSRHAWEGSVGFALRPIENERVNIFGRYALTRERSRRVVDVPTEIDQSHVGALAVLLSVSPPLDVGPKLYYRHSTVRRGSDRLSDRAALGALRADWHATETWDASVEGRACSTIARGEPTRYGALAEASALVLPWLRLGAGYNLTDMAAEGVACQQAGARGVFVRMEAVY